MYIYWHKDLLWRFAQKFLAKFCGICAVNLVCNHVKTGLFWFLLKSKNFKLLGADPQDKSEPNSCCGQPALDGHFRVWSGEEWGAKATHVCHGGQVSPTMRAGKANDSQGTREPRNLWGGHCRLSWVHINPASSQCHMEGRCSPSPHANCSWTGEDFDL